MFLPGNRVMDVARSRFFGTHYALPSPCAARGVLSIWGIQGGLVRYGWLVAEEGRGGSAVAFSAERGSNSTPPHPERRWLADGLPGLVLLLLLVHVVLLGVGTWWHLLVPVLLWCLLVRHLLLGWCLLVPVLLLR